MSDFPMPESHRWKVRAEKAEAAHDLLQTMLGQVEANEHALAAKNAALVEVLERIASHPDGGVALGKWDEQTCASIAIEALKDARLSEDEK